MDVLNFVHKVFGKKDSAGKAPFVIINKDTEVIEYENIETAIAELEKTLTFQNTRWKI